MSGGRIFEHTITVGWGDCDPAAIVFYPNYFAWFDEATHLMFRHAGMPMDAVEKRFGVIFPLVEASARFLRPSRYGEAIAFKTTVEAWHEKRLTVLHQGYRDGHLLLDGRELRVCSRPHPEDPVRLQSVPIPKEIVKAFK
ncbi:MAG: acyl-CoA thioesterase [Betaproteobacteria bacterium]|nr:acyl-CoA thioesterase [Betaproteobacteria bacterium]